jgi:signal-transduction protein with cAMP-binding, CBS, and nucleotidyltransferase domain
MSGPVQKVSGVRNAAAEVSRISSSAMLSEAADRMRTLDTDSLRVVENNEIIGRITTRGIAQAASAGLNPTTTPVKYVMTSDATSAPEEEVENTAAMGSSGPGEPYESSCD